MKPINELIKIEESWLDEVYDRLWYEYYTPFAPLNKETKAFLREQINFIADEHNKAFSSETMQLKKLTAKDTWENDGNGPLSDKKLYIDCLAAVVVPPPPKKKKVTEEEDLLGISSKPKTAKIAAPEGKTKYDVIAELAAKGKTKDEIQEATGFERKTVTDLLWRWNKLNPKK